MPQANLTNEDYLRLFGNEVSPNLIAKQAQDTSLPNWASDIALWIKQLSNEWSQNVAELEAYLENNS